MEQVKPLSLSPVPVEGQKQGEQRNEVTSSASATFLQREGARRRRGKTGESWRRRKGENVPKLLRLRD